MKKSGKVLCLLFLTASLIGLCSCKDHKSAFSGSKTGNDDHFLVDFEVLNTTVCGTMPLLEGESVDATVDITEGAIDIVVENEKGIVVYHNSDMVHGRFTIDIAETGTYTFNLTGFQARGSVHFYKQIRLISWPISDLGAGNHCNNEGYDQ
ncbi:MAG: hypothetical protein VB070_13105 [Clostridiaceae bacterium]|nr:hypothetical protein [Clostridiaceae bacterium]